VQFDPVMVEAMVSALHEHGWQVQGADDPRLPITLDDREDREPVARELPQPRAVAAYSSVETDS
jgi:hypothetical protein